MNTHFRRFKMLSLRTMAGEALKDDANKPTSCFLKDFDDVLRVYWFVRRKSALCRTLRLQKPQLNTLRQFLSDHAISKLA